MRTFIVLAVTVALASQVASAQAAGGRSTTFRVSSLRVLYGHTVTLTGRLASHTAGRHVAIIRRPYGRTTPMPAAVVVTRGGGYWSYRARPPIQTTYQARVGSSLSRAVTIGVQPAVSVRELGAGRLAVHVLPARRFAGRMIKVQRLVAAAAWHTLLQKQLGARSALVFSPSIPSSTIRIALSVNQAGAGYLGGVSHRLRYHAYSLSLAPSGYRIRFGSPLTLSGRLNGAGPGQMVTIYQQQFKRSSPFRIATVRTGAGGRWSYSVKPVVQVSFFARSAKLQSRRVRIGVMPLLTAKLTGNGRVRAHVFAAGGFKGRLVKLQHEVGNGIWQTLVQKPLDYRSEVLFPQQSQSGVLRVAMSVNEAGAGYLGSLSKPLTYRAT